MILDIENSDLFVSDDGRWVITRSLKTGSFRLHCDGVLAAMFIGGMSDLRQVSELATLAYSCAHEQFVEDLDALEARLAADTCEECGRVLPGEVHERRDGGRRCEDCQVNLLYVDEDIPF